MALLVLRDVSASDGTDLVAVVTVELLGFGLGAWVKGLKAGICNRTVFNFWSYGINTTLLGQKVDRLWWFWTIYGFCPKTGGYSSCPSRYLLYTYRPETERLRVCCPE
jgi:hypothetical protein